MRREIITVLELAFIRQLDLATLGQSLRTLGADGFISGAADAIRTFLVSIGVAEEGIVKEREEFTTWLVATNHLSGFSDM
jgi:hypothetical protein